MPPSGRYGRRILPTLIHLLLLLSWTREAHKAAGYVYKFIIEGHLWHLSAVTATLIIVMIAAVVSCAGTHLLVLCSGEVLLGRHSERNLLPFLLGTCIYYSVYLTETILVQEPVDLWTCWSFVVAVSTYLGMSRKRDLNGILGRLFVPWHPVEFVLPK